VEVVELMVNWTRRSRWSGGGGQVEQVVIWYKGTTNTRWWRRWWWRTWCPAPAFLEALAAQESLL
jgi:hypothetical protein